MKSKELSDEAVMSNVRSLLKSYNKFFKVEVTTTLGCPVDCVYCPQEQLKKESKTRKKRIEFADFVKAINNIDIKTNLGWTGYSEPCLSPILGKMVQHASSNGINQYISTTLSGNSESVEFVIKSKDFYSFQLHLPDSLGLMKGLKVDHNYAQRVKLCLEQKYKDGLAHTVDIICFGEDLHPLIKDTVLNVMNSWGRNNNLLDLRTKVYSRANGLDKDQLKISGLRTREFSNNINGTDFYCARRKMNSPVLLPDGSLSMCSFDYGFRMTYGNLFNQKLSEIRKDWVSAIATDFNSGKLSPCTECEFYFSS